MALMWASVMLAPSSVRRRFSSRIFRAVLEARRPFDPVQPVDLVRRVTHAQCVTGAEAVRGHEVSPPQRFLLTTRPAILPYTQEGLIGQAHLTSGEYLLISRYRILTRA